MDVGKIYADATGQGRLQPELTEQNLADLEAAKQLSLQTKIDWIKSARTQEIFEEINTHIHKLEETARQQAKQFASTGNPLEIINNLNEARIMREFLTKYGYA